MHFWCSGMIRDLVSDQSILAQCTCDRNYKLLTLRYLVPSRIAKFAPNYLALCFCGCPNPGTYMHTWLTCPVVQAFWNGLFTLASRMFNYRHLLNHQQPFSIQDQTPWCVSNSNLWSNSSSAAKQTIVKAWNFPSLAVEEVTQSKPHTNTRINGSYRQH